MDVLIWFLQINIAGKRLSDKEWLKVRAPKNMTEVLSNGLDACTKQLFFWKMFSHAYFDGGRGCQS